MVKKWQEYLSLSPCWWSVMGIENSFWSLCFIYEHYHPYISLYTTCINIHMLLSLLSLLSSSSINNIIIYYILSLLSISIRFICYSCYLLLMDPDGSDTLKFQRLFVEDSEASFAAWDRGRTSWNELQDLPSGELTFCHGKSPLLMGKSTISMIIFNCYVSSPEGTKFYEGIMEFWISGIMIYHNYVIVYHDY